MERLRPGLKDSAIPDKFADEAVYVLSGNLRFDLAVQAMALLGEFHGYSQTLSQRQDPSWTPPVP